MGVRYGVWPDFVGFEFPPDGGVERCFFDFGPGPEVGVDLEAEFWGEG